MVCNNAGVAVIGAVHEHTLADWQWVINVNLWGVIHGVRAFLPRMLAGGDEGHFVNTASMAGLTTSAFMSVYDVTKHGVVALSESMYKELTATGAPIGVSVVCPGLIDTNIMRSSRNRPESLGEEGKAGPMAQAFGQALSDRLAGGYPPSEVAEPGRRRHPGGALLHRARSARSEGQHRDPRPGPARAPEPDAAPRLARCFGGHEAQEGELRRRAEAHGRTPCPRAGTDVDPHAAAAREPGRVRPVDPMNHERPREELAGVRVSRQLQVEAGLLGQRRDLRIVRQEQTEGRPRGAVGREVRTGPRVGIGHSAAKSMTPPIRRRAAPRAMVTWALRSTRNPIASKCAVHGAAPE